MQKNDTTPPVTPFARMGASMRKRGFAGFIAHIFLDIFTAVARRLAWIRDNSSASEVTGTIRDSQSLIVILAGYKPVIWPLMLRRIARHAPKDHAVCVVTAGKSEPKLAAFCVQNRWCYLSVKKNKTGLALNQAIALHPKARWIYKLDEDIFIPAGFFQGLRRGYERIVKEGVYRPGFCSPTLNVNGVSYRHFLEATGNTRAYLKQFGELAVACDGVKAHYDPQAAVWLWRRTLPLEKVAKRFSGRRGADRHLISGTRFSIGAILLERDFLESVGGFRSTWRQKMLGIDESFLCAACVERSRPMIVLKDVLAGHFSFYTQEQAMLAALPSLAAADPDCFGSSAPAGSRRRV